MTKKHSTQSSSFKGKFPKIMAVFEIVIRENDEQILVEISDWTKDKVFKIAIVSPIHEPNSENFKEEKRISVRCLMENLERIIQSRVWPEHTIAYEEREGPYGMMTVVAKNSDGTTKYLA